MPESISCLHPANPQRPSSGPSATKHSRGSPFTGFNTQSLMATKTQQAVSEFLAQLPPGRRRAIDRVRDIIREHLPAGYEEVVSKRMLVYQVPLRRYSETYNGQPLWYVALASEKSYLSLHLMSIYGDPVQ